MILRDSTISRLAKRRLIITCDDCGLSEGINNSSYALHQAGLCTTATVMMNFSATQHALEMLADTPTLAAGVHLNLTDGAPLTNIGSETGLTTPDGRFQPRAILFTRALFSSNGWGKAVENEMREQIELFISETGRYPSHLTTHMHFHIMPNLREIVFRLAEDYGVPWVRAFLPASTIIPYNFLVQEPAELFRPDNLQLTPDYVVSVQAWLQQEPEMLVKTLTGLNGTIEMVVHADTTDDRTYPEGMSHRPAERERELRYLESLAEALQDTSTFAITDPALG